VTLASALIVLTCGTRREPAPPPAAPLAPPPADTLAQGAAQASAESQAPPLPTAVPMPPPADLPATASASASAPPEDPRRPGHELDRFFAALHELEQHTRKSHVRVAWLGDSHGASDLWSGPLRSALQARFGDGGPGFVHVGYKAYRHEGMHIETTGRWGPTPKGPSTPLRTGDGTFGVGGVIYTGTADSPRATLTVTDPGLPATLKWDLCYKPATERDEISLAVTGLPDRVLKADDPLGLLRHLSFSTTGASPQMRIVPLGGQPGFCGVTIETDPATSPGVVLDTLGINGARLATPLAWNEPAWVTELSRRAPNLVILEYGTNESSDHTIRSETYVEHLRRLMARVHTAASDCDCLVLAPTDRADTLDRTPLVRDALRDAARASGCGFWDTYTVMGGRGSIVAWHAESPPRAGADGVHLTPRGYKGLGDRLAADVLAGYRP
jgi:lysophospholipase L1-like esterase